jgi:hypothetical protein
LPSSIILFHISFTSLPPFQGTILKPIGGKAFPCALRTPLC